MSGKQRRKIASVENLGIVLGAVLGWLAVSYGFKLYFRSKEAPGKAIQARAVRAWSADVPGTQPPPAASGGAQWTAVTDHGVSIEFPGPSKKSTTTLRTTIGTVRYTLHEADVGQLYFFFGVFEYPHLPDWNVQRSLQGGAKASLHKLRSLSDVTSSRVLYRRAKNLGGLPGIDLAFGANSVSTGRIWMLEQPPRAGAGAVGYQVMAGGPNELAGDPRIAEFFRSVRIAAHADE